VKPEWVLSSPFGPKPLWTIMNAAWDGRIAVTISAVPSTPHASGLGQKILLCQFDAETHRGEGTGEKGKAGKAEGKADLEDGLVSRRTEILEGPDGRHVLNPGRYGKTVAWCARSRRSRAGGGGGGDIPDFFFVDRRGTDPDDPAEAEGMFTKYATCDEAYGYRFSPPAWVSKHGRMLDMDFDDGRGKLALAMEDGTTVLFEF